MKVKILTLTGDNKSSRTTQEFEKQLNKALEDGWELSGDLQISTSLQLSTQYESATFMLTYSQRLTMN